MHDAAFLELIKDQDLFSGDLAEQVQAKVTRMEKAAWFLDNAIDCPVRIHKFEPWFKLLTVMANEVYLKNDSLKQLAVEIEQELDKETSVITMKGTARGY